MVSSVKETLIYIPLLHSFLQEFTTFFLVMNQVLALHSKGSAVVHTAATISFIIIPLDFLPRSATNFVKVTSIPDEQRDDAVFITSSRPEGCLCLLWIGTFIYLSGTLLSRVERGETR